MDKSENGNSFPSNSTILTKSDSQKDPEFQKKPFWQRIVEIGAQVPQEEWRKHLPKNSSCNFEHYMYSTSRDQ